MEFVEILTSLLGIAVLIIGYFLRETMENCKGTSKTAYNNKTKIQVMETEYLNKMERLDERLDEKFNMLYTAIDKLTLKIEELNKELNNKD